MDRQKKISNSEKQDETKQTKNKTSDMLRKTCGNIVTSSKKILNQGKKKIDEFTNIHKLKKEIIKQTYEFLVEGTNKTFRGFKNSKEDVIFCSIEDEILTKYVKSNDILIRTSDNLKLIVVSIETKELVNRTLMVNENEYSITLWRIYTKKYEKDKVTTIINNVTQTMTITDSTVQGNIQQINDLETRLNEFETQLRAFKPKFFQKNNYTEAIKIYGDVKNSIINGQKENISIVRFVDLIKKISIPLLNFFISIIK